MSDMGTRLAAEKWGVSQRKVQLWCKKIIITDKRITQDKKGSTYHIPADYPNPFINTKVLR